MIHSALCFCQLGLLTKARVADGGQFGSILLFGRSGCYLGCCCRCILRYGAVWTVSAVMVQGFVGVYDGDDGKCYGFAFVR
jgi:hypothetical protein